MRNATATAEEWQIRYEVVTSGMNLSPEVVEQIKQISDHIVNMSRTMGMTTCEAASVMSSAIMIRQSATQS